MASPSNAAIAKNDLYKAKSWQALPKTMVTWWRRLQRLGILTFGDPCTWTEDQQEVIFSCLFDVFRYPRDLAKAANKDLLFAENYAVRLGHLADLTQAVGESRPTQELTHHFTLHPSDSAYNSLGVSQSALPSKTSSKPRVASLARSI